MALIRSLNTAVSGLKAQQMRIEVVGNNIANVDTTAFKAARPEFATILSQVQTNGMAPNGFLGGIDPVQVGLGTYVGATPKDFNQGPLKTTGVASDMAITGDGFFILRDGSGNEVYTRDGSFTINPANFLHDPVTGYVVQGFVADKEFQVNSGSPLKDIEIPLGVSTIARATTSVTLEGNLDASGQVASQGTGLFSEALYDASRPNTGLITEANPLGLERATADSRLQDLVRSLGNFTPATASSSGVVGTAAPVFPDLQTSPAGLEIVLRADKGERSLPETSFVVGDPPPSGGTTLGELLDFIQGSLGVAGTVNDGVEKVENAFSFARLNPVTGEELNGTISSSDTASMGGITDLGADFRGAQVGDFIRFISGQAAGEMAEIRSISDSNGDGIPDTLTFRTDGFNSLHQLPAVGDAYAIQAPAGVRLAYGDDLGTISGASVGAVTTSGDVSSFTITDGSVTDLTLERGVQAGQEITYLSGGVEVTGTVLSVTGNSAVVGYG